MHVPDAVLKDPTTFVTDFIRLVRKGSFISVFEDAKGREHLAALVAQSSSSWPAIVSRAILAETYDQVGLYKKAEELATFDIGKQCLATLLKDLAQGKAQRNMVRAQTMLILQCAVAQLRRQQTQAAALTLLDETIEILDKINNKKELRSLHVRSLFYFWRGRLYTLQYTFDKAASDFQYALDVTDQNLAQKLPDRMEDTKRDEQVAAGNYALSTCLGFGFGQLRQLEEKLVESLQYLRVAVPLSRGSVDLHRRGYAHLLIGIALRSRGWMDQLNNDLDAADEHLEEAQRLLGGTAGKYLGHHLHLARVYHQLALSKYTRIDPKRDRDKDLQDAEEMNNRAVQESNHDDCKDHRDPVLDYGIIVARSLIKTDLKAYTEALTSANSAIAMIDRVPPATHGWAWVAKGMALAGGLPAGASDRASDFVDAEWAFRQALGREVRETDRAAAHLHLALLYSKVGSSEKASVHYGRAIGLVAQSEHGWIKELAKRVQQRLGEEGLMYRCSFDIDELLRNAKGPAWSHIEEHVLNEVRLKLIRLKDAKIHSDDGVAGVAVAANELGISTSTLYKWLSAAGEKMDGRRNNRRSKQ